MEWNGIIQTTLKKLDKKQIPKKKKKLIVMTADNCAVMMGANNGVESKLKSFVPNFFTNGCICHILNLVSYAASKIQYPKWD